MFSPNQLLLNGVRGARLIPDASTLKSFLELIPTLTDNKAVAAGMVAAAYDCSEGAAEWNTPDGEELLRAALAEHEAIAGTEGENLFTLGRYAAIALDGELEDLVRRARHRDGSTASIVASTATIQLLESAVGEFPEIDAKLKAAGLDLARVSFVDMAAAPKKALPKSAGVVLTGSENPISGAGAPIVGEPGGPRPYWLAPDSPAADEMTVTPELENFAVNVRFNSNMAAVLTLAQTLRIADQLGAAVRSIIRPAEGYKWVDLLEGVGAVLIQLDGVVAKQLGLPERVDMSGWEQGSISQVVYGPDSEPGQAGLFRCRLQISNGGFEDIGPLHSDLNDAKAFLARRVRAVLAALPK